MSGVVLVTGGLGYVGSHTCVALAEAGYKLVIVDNLCNSKFSVLERIRELAGEATVEFYRADLRNREALEAVFAAHRFDAVIHLAGLKSIAESAEKPLLYYDNNVGGTLVLLDAMPRHGVKRIVFSSSATVYGIPEFLPYTEAHPLKPANAYGRTKLCIEYLLGDCASRSFDFVYATLRYFNPIGAHPSGRIGEDPRGIPNNLLPYLSQVAAGQLPKLRVFGKDYETADGTGVRDYIHVMDLAAGHLAALAYLEKRRQSITANLGTGRAYSVLEVVATFERMNGVTIPMEFTSRRVGDVAASFADPSFAGRELGWHARFDLETMCRDAGHWQMNNPDGYPE